MMPGAEKSLTHFAAGLHGNGHMLMLEKYSLEIVRFIESWLLGQVLTV